MTKQFTPPRSSNEFDDLIVREMKGQATVAESNWLHEPGQLYRWHRALEQKLDEGRRHIENRKLMIDRKRADYEMEDESDTDHLSDAEVDDFYTFRDEMEAKNRSTTQFLGYVADAASTVARLIDETPTAYDAAEVIRVVFEARDALEDGEYTVASDAVDEAIRLLTVGMG